MLLCPWGFSKARIPEWVAIPFSKGSSQTRDGTCVSCIGRQILYHWATRESFHYMRTQWKASCSRPRKQATRPAPSRHWTCQSLDRGLPSSRTVKVLLFISHEVSDILLEQTEWTDTVSKVVPTTVLFFSSASFFLVIICFLSFHQCLDFIHFLYHHFLCYPNYFSI